LALPESSSRKVPGPQTRSSLPPPREPGLCIPPSNHSFTRIMNSSSSSPCFRRSKFDPLFKLTNHLVGCQILQEFPGRLPRSYRQEPPFRSWCPPCPATTTRSLALCRRACKTSCVRPEFSLETGKLWPGKRRSASQRGGVGKSRECSWRFWKLGLGSIQRYGGRFRAN